MFILECLGGITGRNSYIDNGDRLLLQTRSLTMVRFSEHHEEQTREDVNANEFVAVVCLRLSAVKYDPLFHSRHNGRHRTAKVGVMK